MSDDIYVLKTKTELEKISNLSSLTYSPYDGYLYATVNKPAKILRITKEGTINRVKDIPFIKDAESIEYFTDGVFLAADEETSILYVISIDESMNIEVKASMQLDVFTG
ncbi:TPA: esterase-like activity of phytase, partial [Escherichia coli]|nr:esterase-like activity of phytase [Escherichia coli]